ncbi:hypothetical protein HG536_0B06020 [Torulaspora globosa]|uniref:THIF-type NAD/FAD binding fold domain-containing protein n=1 Tax=Torulaspora globosa TaxID=48254 RepID=A0A7G3ZE00_9SACH|nr:uncharacterized protein HG536_0B06020 [Torulaspora globosa]QLL31736.1 hypothetical protein HG536_0B06020 [Torulaspora globosa]
MLSRFDRQVRIWGAPAQTYLERAHVCLVAKSFHDALLQEILKSLALTGIGEITLLLEDPESAKDLYSADASSFFAVNETLLGEKLVTDISSWKCLDEPLCVYTIIVAVNLERNEELDWLVRRREPLVVASAKDFSGHVELCLKEGHFVIDSLPGYSIPDVRICDAWPELREFYESFDLAQWLSSGRLSEIPYPVILYHMVKDVAKKDLVNTSSKYVRSKIEEQFPNNLDDLNIIEAKRFAHLAIRSFDHCGRMVKFLLNVGPELSRNQWFDPLNHETAYFLKCLRQYYYRYESLPISGYLPDMESSTELYGRLKCLYRNKHSEDIRCFNDIMSEEGGQPSLPSGAEDVFIRKLRYLEFCPAKPVIYQIPNTGRRPRPLPSVLSRYTEKANEPGGQNEAITFHTSCFIGGVASQEIIKLITHQHVPISEQYRYEQQDKWRSSISGD